jgi:hypothetical protein
MGGLCQEVWVGWAGDFFLLCSLGKLLVFFSFLGVFSFGVSVGRSF